jgi:hypothetical protein
MQLSQGQGGCHRHGTPSNALVPVHDYSSGLPPPAAGYLPKVPVVPPQPLAQFPVNDGGCPFVNNTASPLLASEGVIKIGNVSQSELKPRGCNEGLFF